MEIIKTVPENISKSRLDKVCSEIFDDFSRSQLKKWILEGRILLNNEIALPKDLVSKNDEISLNPVSEEKISWQAEDISFDVIFENKDYLIINKPFNLVMHPGAGCNQGTLANGLLFFYPELKTIPRAGIVHRLDKDTSGILLVAKTERFRNYFVQLLQERKVKKLYKAVVVGKTVGSFEISEPIGRDRNNRTKMSIRSDGKEALTFVKLNESLNNYSLLDVRIETGRTHQIRVHLGNKKLPIIGDKTYNPSNNIAKETPKELIETIRTFPRQALHSYQLSFMDMDTDEMMSFVAPLPDDIKKLIETLKKHT
jgi:23S rRNA pseudouridine1911/1915/1917 synthase